MSKKELLRKKICIKWHPSRCDIQDGAKAINLHYLGTESCNKYVDGKLASIDESKETKKFIDAHHNLNQTSAFSIEVMLDQSGVWQPTSELRILLQKEAKNVVRKILYSPGYGAGWVSWHLSSKEQRLFMLEYKPFIDAIEAENGSKERKMQDYTFNHDPATFVRAPACLPMDQFVTDWKAKFGDACLPFMGGLRDIEVATVSGPIRLEDHDGYENFEQQGEYDDYL